MHMRLLGQYLNSFQKTNIMPSHWSIRQKHSTFDTQRTNHHLSDGGLRKLPRDVAPSMPTQNWSDRLGRVYCETDSHGAHGFGGVSARGIVVSCSGGGYVSLLTTWAREKKKGKASKPSNALKRRVRALKKKGLTAKDIDTVLVQLGSNDCDKRLRKVNITTLFLASFTFIGNVAFA